MSLAVLVVIEMFNAMNAISEDGSLLSMPPWVNPYLLLAIVISMITTYAIIYVPAFAAMFSIVPLTYNDWILVIAWSVPVILIDEVLKLFGRAFVRKELAERLASEKKTN
jgi:Ca2+-transporting ATPase